MEYTEYKNIKDFLDVNEKYFLENEAVYGLMYGLTLQLIKNPLYFGSKALLATIGKPDESELVVMMTPPYKIQIMSPGDFSKKIIEKLATEIFERNWQVPAVMAEKDVANTFAEKWSSLKKCTIKSGMKLRIHKLDKVNSEIYPDGKFRKATIQEFDPVYSWVKAFHYDCFGDNEPDNELDTIEEKIMTGSLYFWETDKPVSMAARLRPTPNGETVNLVYTPPEFRGKGYATAVVSKLSQKILDDGKKFCTLFTDLANPTSNSIYKKIGYNPVADVVDILFVE